MNDQLEEELLDDLTEYTHMPRDLVAERCRTAIVELAWLWHKNEGGIEAYYRDTDLYLFDLTRYQSKLALSGAALWASEVASRYGIQKVLDFGGGIGDWSIRFREAGARVYYSDLDGSQTKQYALWRFNRHHQSIEVLGESAWQTHKPYDLIIAMDVLEHLLNPQELIEQFARCSNFLMANPEQVLYNAWSPQHISHYDLTEHWEHLYDYLWVRRGYLREASNHHTVRVDFVHNAPIPEVARGSV